MGNIYLVSLNEKLYNSVFVLLDFFPRTFYFLLGLIYLAFSGKRKRPLFKVGRVSKDPEFNNPQRNMSVIESTKLIAPRRGNSLPPKREHFRLLSEPNETRISSNSGLELHQNIQRVDKKIRMKKTSLPSLCNIRLALSSQVNKLGDNSHVRLIQELRGNRHFSSIKEAKTMLAENSVKLLANKIGLRKALYLCAKKNSEAQEGTNKEKSRKIVLVGKNFNVSKFGEDFDYFRDNDSVEERRQSTEYDENRYQHIDPFSKNKQDFAESPKAYRKVNQDLDSSTETQCFFSTDVPKKKSQIMNIKEDNDVWKEDNVEEMERQEKLGFNELKNKQYQKQVFQNYPKENDRGINRKSLLAPILEHQKV